MSGYLQMLVEWQVKFSGGNLAFVFLQSGDLIIRDGKYL